MVNIFCSHSSKDASWIAPLKNVVESVGHSMYLFEDDQRPGEYVSQKLQQAIEKADVMETVLAAVLIAAICLGIMYLMTHE